MLEFDVVIIVMQYIFSPVGPAVVLFLGAITVLAVGRWVRQPGWLAGLALFFVGVSVWLFLGLRAEPVVPTFSRPWQPPLQTGTNLLWVGDGWNWYISGLVLLLGGVGILLDLNSGLFDAVQPRKRRTHSSLAIHMGVLAAGLMFVGSGNVLTVMLTWVVLDLLILVRGGLSQEPAANGRFTWSHNQGKGLSLVGAILLLMGLLPAGPQGLSQALQGGALPPETVGLMLLAALIRAGIYPFHLWLLPSDRSQVNVAERLLDHMVPVLCGLWLLGWATGLGAEYILFQPDILLVLILALLGSAIAGWTAPDKPNHITFVLITSAGLAAVAGTLAYEPGPAGLIWPTTAFALGGALWLVGDQVWQAWGWQLPVSVGALALAGVPFTPGFLTQPSLARMLMAGSLFLVLFALYVAAQSVQIAAMLRSWSNVQRSELPILQPGVMIRLLAATIAIGLPLAIVGFFPRAVAELANLPNAIPPVVGNPPSVVADLPVWIAIVIPVVMGIVLVTVRPILWDLNEGYMNRLSSVTRLEWLFQLIWWAINQVAYAWSRMLAVVEGAGYFGWVLVFVLMGYLLVR